MRAGTDTLEHSADLEPETLAQMAARKICYVPTIDLNRFYADNAKLEGIPVAALPGLQQFIARNLETARQAHRAGVRFCMGSDAVRSMFGENTRELGWFVKAGLTPEQALKSATVNAAEALGKSGELGALKPGFSADIAAVDGNPLEDINVVITRVRWVMKAGEVMVDKTR